MYTEIMAFDAASQRTKDVNGYLRVAVSHITKETVNPYRGKDIPGWRERGLDPEKVYMGYREGAALKKAASSFNGLPLLLDHYMESAANPQKEHRVGSLGTDAEYNAPYLDNSLIITDENAIRKVESGAMKEISAAYRYVPVWEPGTFQGQQYDFIMRDIVGNHVALVSEGRAGHDVVVADAMPDDLRERDGMDEEKRSQGPFAALIAAIKTAQEHPDADAEEIIDKYFPDVSDDVKEKASEIIELSRDGDEVEEDEDDDCREAMAEYGLDADNEDVVKAFKAGCKHASEQESAEDEEEENDMAVLKKKVAKDCKKGEKRRRHKGTSKALVPYKHNTALTKYTGDAAFDDDDDIDNLDDDILEDDDEELEVKKHVPEAEDDDEIDENNENVGEDEDDEEAEDDDEEITPMTAKRIAQDAKDATITKVRKLYKAAEDCAPVIGRLKDPLAFDSAGDIYAKALKACGVDVTGIHRSAYPAMLKLAKQRANVSAPRRSVKLAMDSKDNTELDAVFAGLDSIRK